MRSSKALEKRRLRFLIHHLHLMALVQVYCLLVYWFMLELSTDNQISREVRKHRAAVRQELLYQILTSRRTREVIRMGPRAFLDLCKKLETEGGLRPTRQASIEEQVAKFLHILGHNVRNRPICFFFRRSGETNCRHFHKVLKSVIMLGGSYFHQPDGSQVPIQVSSDHRYFPYFKDCLGAIDRVS